MSEWKWKDEWNYKWSDEWNLGEGMNEMMYEILNKLMKEWMTKWINESMKGCLNKWINESHLIPWVYKVYDKNQLYEDEDETSNHAKVHPNLKY